MGSKYRQLTEQDRIFIDLMLSKHYSKSKIAAILKVHPSTIYREIKRNGVKFWWEAKKYYIGSVAQEARIKRRKRGLKLEKDPDLRQYVHTKLGSEGSEFKKYDWIKNCVDAEIYFCEPASPHQKGAVENVNGTFPWIYRCQ